ncbi:MAG TPA: alpha/beta hydrolase [Chloroflexota bacterium]|jgi:pimeloyl-ACP methyl ester carboxylesterase
MPPQDEGRVTAGDCAIAYHAAGDGPLVGYLHGAGGLRWGRALDRLAARFHVIAFDLPGFGDSTLGEGVNSIPEMSDAVAGAMAEVGRGERMHLIGTSLGGWTAAWLAVRHPDRVDRLVLESPAAFRPPDAPPLSSFAPDELRRRLYGNPEQAPPTDDPAVRQQQFQVMARLTTGHTAWDRDLEARLGEIAAETLVLFGTLDGLIPPETGRIYKERIPQAFLSYVYQAAHAIQWDRPDAFADLVADFLERGEAFVVPRAAAAG